MRILLNIREALLEKPSASRTDPGTLFVLKRRVLDYGCVE